MYYSVLTVIICIGFLFTISFDMAWHDLASGRAFYLLLSNSLYQIADAMLSIG
jgi:hypothetical protein